jgi:hypothetical protein
MKRKHGHAGSAKGPKDDLMRLVEREMMAQKSSRQKLREIEAKKIENRDQEETLQKDIL